MGNGRFSGGSYTNQALTQAPRGKKQAPMPPRGQEFGFGQGAVATGTLISFDTPPSSPSGSAPPVVANGGSNIRSLLDEDFPEPAGGSSLLDMDIPPMISASLSVDNFGSTPFDPFAPQPRKSSLPVVTSTKNMFPPISLRTPESIGRIGKIREEFSAPPEGSPPPPRFPAPQLNPLETSIVTSTQPCGMALADYTNPKAGELSYSQYEFIELIAEHDEVYFLARLDDHEGLVRKDAVEVLTPLDEPQQDSEPESQQDAYNHRQRPSSSTSTTDDKPETERYISSQKPVASVSPFSSQQQTKNEEAEQAIALYDFDAQQEDELSFKAGDRLLVTSRFDQDWLYGCTVKDSQFGIFPASFVQLGSECGSETESLKEAETRSSDKANGLNNGHAEKEISQSPTSDGCPVVALFAFSPEQEGDLGFDEGEVIAVLSRINKDWLMGRNSKGETGQFPASFVQPADESATIKKSGESVSGVYVCLYDFEAQQTDDLALRAGDKIRVTEKVSEEWWQGHVLGSSREGIFPSNFVEPL